MNDAIKTLKDRVKEREELIKTYREEKSLLDERFTKI